MSDSFSVDTSDLFRLVQGCEAASHAVVPELTRAMVRSVLPLERDTRDIIGREAFDTGALMRSITHEVTATGTGVNMRVFSTSPYADIVHDGRNPGRMPPQGALLGWMGRHGIPASAEFVIRRAIGRRKGKPIKFFDRAWAKNRAAIDREFSQVSKRVIAKLAGR